MDSKIEDDDDPVTYITFRTAREIEQERLARKRKAPPMEPVAWRVWSEAQKAWVLTLSAESADAHIVVGIALLIAVAYLVGYELWKWIGAMF